jgi:hypothetical protein
MPDDHQEKKNDSYFPPDVGAIGSLLFIIMAVVYVSCGLSWAKARGDTTLFNLAVFLGCVGAVLLFIARIPLYRQRRFFTLGPSSLSGIYRKLYFTAYAFIVPSIVLLVLLLLAFR